jgi:hypothetical protein
MKIGKAKKIIGCSIVAVTLVLSGCGIFKTLTSENTAFLIAYDLDEIIREPDKVATIISIYDFSVNNVDVTPRNMRSSVRSRGGRSLVVDVLPGKHTIQLTTPVDASGNIVVNIPDTHNFEAGQIYELGVASLSVVSITKKKSAKTAEKIAALRRNATFTKQ